MGPLEAVPHLVVEPDVTAQLPGDASKCTTNWCVAEGRAEAPTNNSPDGTANAEAEHVEEHGEGCSDKGFHEYTSERHQS